MILIKWDPLYYNIHCNVLQCLYSTMCACVVCLYFILLSELVFSLGFSQCFSLKGFFTSVFFPWWMLGHHPPKFVFVCGPSSSLCSVCIVSTNDFLVWRAQQAPYHILVLAHVWHAGMLLHAVSIVRED